MKQVLIGVFVSLMLIGSAFALTCSNGAEYYKCPASFASEFKHPEPIRTMMVSNPITARPDCTTLHAIGNPVVCRSKINHKEPINADKLPFNFWVH